LRVVRSAVTVANPVPSMTINIINSVRARVYEPLYFFCTSLTLEKRIVIRQCDVKRNAGIYGLGYIVREINELISHIYTIYRALIFISGCIIVGIYCQGPRSRTCTRARARAISTRDAIILVSKATP